MVSIQSSYTFASKCGCSSPSINLMSCSFLTLWLSSFSCLSSRDVICGTSCLCSISYVSCGVIICGIFIICLATYTTIDNALTTISIIDGSTLPLVILCALKFVLSCSLFTLEHEALPSSTLLFLLRALLGEFVATFFLFSNVVCISSLILLTLVGDLCGFSF